MSENGILGFLGHTLSIFGWLSICFFIYLFGLFTYRLFFHPLVKYPGPFLAKISPWPCAYHAWKGDLHLELWRNHEKYGKFVRYAPNGLSVNTNTALKDIYGFKSNVRKSEFYEAFPVNKNAHNTHNVINKQQHAAKRRILSQAFSDNALKSMEDYILKHVRNFCDSLVSSTTFVGPYEGGEKSIEKWSPAKNIADHAGWMTYDVMGDLCFGKSFYMLEKEENRFGTDLVATASSRHFICGSYLPLHTYHLDQVLFRSIAEGRVKFMNYCRQQLAERSEKGLDIDRKDFFYYLLKAKDPETNEGFTTPQLWGEAHLLMIAGSDTTSTAIASTFFYLVHNPHVLEILKQEVRSTFSSLEEIRSGQKLNSLNYLRACCDEAMRLSPSNGSLLPRTVLPGGITIDGHFIPESLTLTVPPYSIHHNADYYPEPFTYVPSRWLLPEHPQSTGFTRDQVATAQSAFCPFSVGPRGCIGKGMAYMEMSITLARAVWLFDFQLQPGSTLGEGKEGNEYGRHRPSEYQMTDIFVSKKDGPMVQFRPRLA